MALPCLLVLLVGTLGCVHHRFVLQQNLAKDHTRCLLHHRVCILHIYNVHWLESPFLPHLLPNAQLLLRRRIQQLLEKLW